MTDIVPKQPLPIAPAGRMQPRQPVGRVRPTGPDRSCVVCSALTPSDNRTAGSGVVREESAVREGPWSEGQGSEGCGDDAASRGTAMSAPDLVRDVYDASYRRLVVQMLAICGDQAEAEDAVQEAF